MNLLKRISNLWKMSEYKPDMEVYLHGLDENVSHVSLVVKKPIIKRPAVFIAHHPIDPIQELVNEPPV